MFFARLLCSRKMRLVMQDQRLFNHYQGRGPRILVRLTLFSTLVSIPKVSGICRRTFLLWVSVPIPAAISTNLHYWKVHFTLLVCLALGGGD